MDSQKEDGMAGEEISSPKRKGRSLPIEQHYFRFERNRNMLCDEEQGVQEKDRHRLRERQRRENMTDEQRSLERERRRLRDEQRRKSMSDEQKTLEKERRRIRERQRRSNMNDEQRAVEMERRRIRERQHRQNMDDEQRARDRERRRERDKQRRENMNDEQRAQEKERRRLYEEHKRGIAPRGNAPNVRLVARRKRREEARKRLLMSQNDQISGVEQDNENALYSFDSTDGNQTLAPTQDHLQVEMTNTSEWSSTTTPDLSEGAVAVYNGNHVLGNQNSSSYSAESIDGNQIHALTQDNLKVAVGNTSERGSTTTPNLNKGTMVMHNGTLVVGNKNVSHSTDATDGNQIVALTPDNQKVEVTNTTERSSTTSLNLNENAMVVCSVSTNLPVVGHETTDVHIGDEGNAGDADKESENDSKQGKEVHVVNL